MDYIKEIKLYLHTYNILYHPVRSLENQKRIYQLLLEDKEVEMITILIYIINTNMIISL
jgi:hypothetical protein